MSQVQQTLETEVIWRTLSDRLRHFIRAHIRSAADADDILQIAFLRIHQNVSQLRHTDRLEPWVFQIVRNAIADHFRKTRPDVLEGGVESTPTTDASAHKLNGEVADCLGRMIDQLPDNLQRAVQMYEQQGISQQEIAERESISLSGAKSRVQRGRKLLRQLLETCCHFQFDRRGNIFAWRPILSHTEPAIPCDCRTCTTDPT